MSKKVIKFAICAAGRSASPCYSVPRSGRPRRSRRHPSTCRAAQCRRTWSARAPRRSLAHRRGRLRLPTVEGKTGAHPDIAEGEELALVLRAAAQERASPADKVIESPALPTGSTPQATSDALRRRRATPLRQVHSQPHGVTTTRSAPLLLSAARANASSTLSRGRRCVISFVSVS
jgi:hypothetical protein